MNRKNKLKIHTQNAFIKNVYIYMNIRKINTCIYRHHYRYYARNFLLSLLFFINFYYFIYYYTLHDLFYQLKCLGSFGYPPPSDPLSMRLVRNCGCSSPTFTTCLERDTDRLELRRPIPTHIAYKICGQTEKKKENKKGNQRTNTFNIRKRWKHMASTDRKCKLALTIKRTIE